MFKRDGIYHLLMGSCCCFCESGTNLMLYTSTSALGPFTLRHELNPVVDKESGKLTLPCQQQGITAIHGGPDRGDGTEVALQLMWSGERWQQSPDGRKEHDPQAWVPIEFGADDIMQPLSFVQSWSPGTPIVPTPHPPISCAASTFRNGTCFQDREGRMPSNTNGTATHCCAQCAAAPGCQAWTLWNGGVRPVECALFSNVGPFGPGNCVSGTGAPAPPPSPAPARGPVAIAGPCCRRKPAH